LLYNSVVPVVTEYGDALADKIIIDISNPFNATFDGLAHNEQTSIAQEVTKVAPASASVVKAFNTIFRNVLENGRPDVFSFRKRVSICQASPVAETTLTLGYLAWNPAAIAGSALRSPYTTT